MGAESSRVEGLVDRRGLVDPAEQILGKDPRDSWAASKIAGKDPRDSWFLRGFVVSRGSWLSGKGPGIWGGRGGRDKGLRRGSANTASANGGEEESSDKGLKWGNYKYVFVKRRNFLGSVRRGDVMGVQMEHRRRQQQQTTTDGTLRGPTGYGVERGVYEQRGTDLYSVLVTVGLSSANTLPSVARFTRGWTLGDWYELVRTGQSPLVTRGSESAGSLQGSSYRLMRGFGVRDARP
ncbi:hypothetical protein FA13DRAFT_1916989 [Coprinellus micaceus]|uniref:Uncharacterized protein n=1 Tax=Coprinellus micaceus TaxID=71717 RepID=A0A4Y7SMV1_COPMI|nr:hypothetical protein FA13DRAFT_1916989 [Coprinellus micaceus]